MATLITITGSATLDESENRQISNVAATGEDNNDSDILLSSVASTVPTFYNRLITGLGLDPAFGTLNGAAKTASNFISVSGGTVTNLGFVDGSGGAMPVYGSGNPGVATLLSAVDGGAIKLFADSVLGNRMVLGVDADGDIVFALYLDPAAAMTTAQVWMVQFEAISNPDDTNPDDAVNLFDSIGVAATTSQDFNFNALPSGQNLFGIVGDPAAGLVVIGKTPVLNADGTFTNASNTINTSQGGGPTTIGVNNQMFDPGDGAYFTFIKNPVTNYLAGAVGGLDQNEADDADNIQYTGGTSPASGGHVIISQTQGGSPATMKLTAYDIAGSPQGQAFAAALGSGTPITITGVTVLNAAGGSAAGVSVSIVGGVATISGLRAGYKVQWTTNAPCDQMLVEGVAGKFDIGGFGLLDTSSTAVDIGAQLRFEDDGPSVTIGLETGAEVRVDESLGENAGEDETGSLGSVTVTGAVLFDSSPDYGTDGAGANALLYGLDLTSEGADSGLVDTVSGLAVRLYTDGDDIVGRITGGTEVLRISIDSSNGDVTVTLERALVHGDDSDDDEADTPLSIAAGLVSAVLTIEDGDEDPASDSVDIGPAIKFEDDGPTADLSLRAGAEVRVDESLGANAGEDETTTLGLVTVTGAVLFSSSPTFGSDDEGTTASVYGLDISEAGVDCGLDDTATGENVLLYMDGDDVVGRISGGIEVLRVSIDSDDGDVSLSISRGVVHPNASNPDEAASPRTIVAGAIFATLTVTDGDDDSDTAEVDIGNILKFEDDGPTIGPVDDGLVDFEAGSSDSHSLNGAVGSDPNDPAYTLIDFTEELTFSNITVEGLLAGDGQSVTYWHNANNNATLGDAGDTAYFRLTLGQNGAGDYTFDVLANAPAASKEFNFNALPSGQNLFGTVGDTASGLVCIGKTPVLNADGTFTNASNTINTSQGGGPTTIGVNNQMFDPGDGAYFTFVKNPVAAFLAGAPGGLDQGEADDADNIQYTGGTTEGTSAFLKIAQIQGNSAATLKLTAYDLAGSPQGQAFTSALGTGTPIAITGVVVTTATGAAASGVSVVISGGVATVSGLRAGYKVEWTTNANHDQVLVEGVAGKFDIGGFGINQGIDTPDQSLDFTALVTDGDGDTNEASWSVDIDGTGIHDDDVVNLLALLPTQQFVSPLDLQTSSMDVLI